MASETCVSEEGAPGTFGCGPGWGKCSPSPRGRLVLLIPPVKGRCIASSVRRCRAPSMRRPEPVTWGHTYAAASTESQRTRSSAASPRP